MAGQLLPAQARHQAPDDGGRAHLDAPAAAAGHEVHAQDSGGYQEHVYGPQSLAQEDGREHGHERWCGVEEHEREADAAGIYGDVEAGVEERHAHQREADERRQVARGYPQGAPGCRMRDEQGSRQRRPPEGYLYGRHAGGQKPVGEDAKEGPEDRRQQYEPVAGATVVACRRFRVGPVQGRRP